MSARRDAIKRYLQRADARRLEVAVSPDAAEKLSRLASFGVSGEFPEVADFYASRLLEQALEDLGDDPAEGLQKMPDRPNRSPVAADPAPDAIVLGADGEPVHLKDQWAEQTALLVFLRHYG